jgi:hypothetical protein
MHPDALAVNAQIIFNYLNATSAYDNFSTKAKSQTAWEHADGHSEMLDNASLYAYNNEVQGSMDLAKKLIRKETGYGR